jgi:anti-sigma factor ChrR (cupin superfamily)
MTEERTAHAIQDLAASHVLGLLEPPEAAHFEAHLQYGCPTCRAEVAALRDVSGALALSGVLTRPPHLLRERVLARVRADAASRSSVLIVPASDAAWETAGPGVMVKYLFCDPERSRRTMLMRVSGGIRRTGHRHGHAEEVFVLEGELALGAVLLRAGDYSGAPPGTLHPETFTDAGCLCLCFAGEINEPLQLAETHVPRPGQVIVRAGEGTWRAAGAGVMTKQLFSDSLAGTNTALVRLQSGTSLPRRAPAAADEIFVLGGSGYFAGRRVSAGDYYRAAPGLLREVRSGDNGCELLMVSSDVGHHPTLAAPRR